MKLKEQTNKMVLFASSGRLNSLKKNKSTKLKKKKICMQIVDLLGTIFSSG